MSLYRKRTEEIEATQWFKNGDHPLDYIGLRVAYDGFSASGARAKAEGWEGAVVRFFRDPTIPGDTECGDCGKPVDAHGWLDTPDLSVCPGDYVLTTKYGHRVMKPKEFEETYEEVEDGA